MMMIIQKPGKVEKWEKEHLFGFVRTFKSRSPGSKLRMLGLGWGVVNIVWGYR